MSTEDLSTDASSEGRRPSLVPRMSLIVCTYRREDALGRLLHHIREISDFGTDAELIIVDNSPEPLAESLVEIASSLPGFVQGRVVRSSPPGLSRARNVGLSFAEGSLVAYLDDDALPCESWLHQLVELFDAYPEVDAVGGPVLPLWTAPRPDWLSADLEGVLSLVGMDQSPRYLKPREYLVGANMAFRREALEEVGGFPEGLGRTGGLLLGNEEQVPQDLIRERHGRTILLAPGPFVRHEIPAERLDPSWFVRRYAWQAVSDVLGSAVTEYELKQMAARLKDLSDMSVLDLMSPVGDDGIGNRVGLLRDLVTVALANTRLELPAPAPHRPSGVDLRTHPSQPETCRPGHAALARSLPSRRVDRLFVEVVNGHEYLYECYESASTHLVTTAFDPWTDEAYVTRLADLWHESLHQAHELKSDLTYLTLDFLARPEVARHLSHPIELGVHVSGFLHRMPESQKEMDGLSVLATRLAEIHVYSLDMAARLRWELGLDNVRASVHPRSRTPHHLAERDQVRDALGVPRDAPLIGMVGEVRQGKNLELLLRSAAEVRRRYSMGLHVLVSGHVKDNNPREIEALAESLGVPCTLDLRQGQRPRDFALLTPQEYHERMVALDVGALLYSDGQALGMSGALPDLASHGVPVVALPRSFVGSEVGRWDLGVVATGMEPKEVAKAIVDCLKSPLRASESRAQYLELSSWEHARMSMNLESEDAHAPE